ncbi:phage integrase SAM-like domain-containing protein [Pedobacter sp. ASV28]|uniref:phage integrase SAM-like domain-containing protein n=1 Tax=Pedobacter sp. ASV28 TaxID=2795123 RepID=UPI0018EAAFDC|nr:phage integrase SAM-like domain-containing protein [Pedobacter sp. ASV28]
MATLDAKIYVHHLKKDGTCNVKIRVYHKEQKRLIDTSHYLCEKQMKPHPENKGEFLIKDPFIKSLVVKELDEYRLAISKLGSRLRLFSPDDLKSYLTQTDEDIDFIKFCDDFIGGLKKAKKNKSASNFNTVRNSLVDFFERKVVLIEEINLDMLFEWEDFLRQERTMIRYNQFGKPVTTVQNPLTDSAIHNYMRDLRSLFNHARKKYNKKSLGIIKIEHYPFEDYKVGEAPETRKRSLDIETLRLIRDCKPEPNSRAELARDLFMLSFYMCGINASDLYQIDTSNIKFKRLDYKRSKTRDKRKDNAFISVKLVDDARPILEKYLGKLAVRYATIGGLNKALCLGMREVCKLISVSGITYYWARHTVGNLARNKCRMSKDDVALALNHVDQGRKTTDIYIDKDWSIVDEVQGNVIKLLNEDLALSYVA